MQSHLKMPKIKSTLNVNYFRITGSLLTSKIHPASLFNPFCANEPLTFQSRLCFETNEEEYLIEKDVGEQNVLSVSYIIWSFRLTYCTTAPMMTVTLLMWCVWTGDQCGIWIEYHSHLMRHSNDWHSNENTFILSSFHA